MYAKFQFSGFAWSCSQDAEIKKTPDPPPKKKKYAKFQFSGFALVMFPRGDDKKTPDPPPPPPPKKKLFIKDLSIISMEK